MMDTADAESRTRAHLRASADVKLLLAERESGAIVAGARTIADALRRGGKLMLCGNGGSAADAQHIAAELTNRFRPDVERPAFAAMSLTTDTSFLTSHANDFAFETIFQRQVEALGRSGDVLIGISTSGGSENVIRAVRACRERGIKTIGLLGGNGGRLRALVDLPLVVPSHNTQYIQESHIAIGHILSDLVERALIGEWATGIPVGALTTPGAAAPRTRPRRTSTNGARARPADVQETV